MKINKHGVHFRYYGDSLLWRWPWSRKLTKTYWSSRFSRDFSDLPEYWQHVGAVDAALARSSGKIEAYSWIEVLTVWIRNVYPLDHLVVLTNLDVSAKGISFWARLPKDKVEHLLQDVVVLRCKDKPEVFRLISSIPTAFADAYGFAGSQLVGTNFEADEE